MTKYVEVEKLIESLESMKHIHGLFICLTDKEKMFNKALEQAILAVNLLAEEKESDGIAKKMIKASEMIPNPTPDGMLIFENADSEIQELKERIALLEAIYEIDQATIKKLFKTNKLLKEHINQH